MDEATLLEDENTDSGYCSENTPLTDSQKNIVIVAHYATFVVCTFALYSFNKKYDVLKSRIWSPFLLMIGLVWLQVGPAFEIGNHFYVNDWELFESQADLINASFSFFNFGAQNLNALGLRKKGVNLCRPIDNLCSCASILDLVILLGDWLFIVLTFVQPIVYVTLGRDASVTLLSPFGAVAGIFSLFRLWFNLGPNKYTKWGGILFFVFAILGVVMLQVYRSTCIEFVHVAIGGSFVTSVIPFSVAILNAEYLPGDVEEGGFPSETSNLIQN